MSNRKDLQWYIDLFGDDKRDKLAELYRVASVESFQNDVPELQDEDADIYTRQALKWLRHVIYESDNETLVFEAILCSHMLCHNVEQYYDRPEEIVSAFSGIVADLLKCGIELEGVERRGHRVSGTFSYVWRDMNKLVKNHSIGMKRKGICS
ncbi:hypothetical protein COU54_01405 [Candidatus Pacearchaeota archaeon CG10_big_fil_rev_8_21_14_0_10_31_24]|nr:MAG: hypothetical protein COU54_01405 [Candidatus Pacearchaeota archaeon CG10_big_fil_rev_8_21_14_0_10_31_24]